MIYMFLAPGFEEAEAVIPLDMLRRAGIDVSTVGISGKSVCGAHGIEITADCLIEDFDKSACDGIILPGGMPGTNNLFANEILKSAIIFCAENKKLLAAICAAPLILGRLGILRGKKAVCYPGFEEELTEALICQEKAVADDNIITAKGAGAAFEFSYEIISYIKDKASAADVLQAIRF